jgi:replicative DNA helicase
LNKYAIQYENECFALGCFIKDPSLLDETLLTDKHFLDPNNKELFKILNNMNKNGDPINEVFLSQLTDSEMMKIGGFGHIEEIINSVPSYNAYESYQKSILAYHVVNEGQSIAKEFMNATKEKHDIRELQKFLNDVSKLETATVQKTASFKELLLERSKQHYDSPMKGLSGVNTGFMNINRLTDGWQKSDLIIVGARPSMGKTALVLNSLSQSCKKDDVFATFFSIEMSKGQIIDRFIANEGRINLMKMRNPNKTFTDEEWDRYTKAMTVLEKMPLDIRDEYTVPAIRSALRRNIKENPDKKHVAAIDFFTLIKHLEPSGNTHSDLSDIIKDLKQICKDLNIPMIVLAQLSRGVEQRQDKRPVMSDIGESGTVEQIADVISFLYRDEYYNPQTETPGITELIIAKNRNGSTGTVKLKFEKTTNTFNDVTFP